MALCIMCGTEIADDVCSRCGTSTTIISRERSGGIVILFILVYVVVVVAIWLPVGKFSPTEADWVMPLIVAVEAAVLVGLARVIVVPPEETAIVTLRAGVAEPLPNDAARQGSIRPVTPAERREPVVHTEILPASPATVDIRHAARLIAGGRGLGGKEGFARLRDFADRIGAGVAASRMAVDLGWIGSERQVGQTGKTVAPKLYIACGISGASHHLEGMSQAEHIVAINTDAEAPIFKIAHLGLVADLYEILELVEKGMGD